MSNIPNTQPLNNPAESIFTILTNTIAQLRSPSGCPWDRKQTHASLRPNLLEECYETLEAIDEDDNRKLCEELGDLQMQIMLHSQIASEEGDFDITDVLQGINSKLVRRHPHVFGGEKASDAKEAAQRWEALKQAERDDDTSMMDGLPQGMPSLTYSHAIQRRAARVGFDWEEEESILDKLVEEINELKKATNHQEKTEEFGDILFTLVNIARRQEIDLEDALRQTNTKFRRRFAHMEGICRERGVSLTDLTLQQQDELWEEAKASLSPKNR
ncbi:MAG: nucleoside triphosphate pyrophosphohydrolase [Chloroflexota bacterium]|nr:nucleoside triphosphate pyrophosphohydrolase [Chloroflexota bacterium]